jgi:PPOX class probable F420-dependent enzyme
MDASERREFVRSHRTAVFGYRRKAHGPAMSIVYYVMDGDDILVSTMAARGKAGAVQRDAKVSLCVLDEQWPPTYVVVYCDAILEAEETAVVDLMMKIAGVMAGNPMPEAVRPMVAEGAKREGRVVLRLRPYATFYTPPRQVNSPADLPTLTHETSASIAW